MRSPKYDWSEHSRVFGGAISVGEDIAWVSWKKRQVDTRVPPPAKKDSYKYAHSLLIQMVGNEVDL